MLSLGISILIEKEWVVNIPHQLGWLRQRRNIKIIINYNQCNHNCPSCYLSKKVYFLAKNKMGQCGFNMQRIWIINSMLRPFGRLASKNKGGYKFSYQFLQVIASQVQDFELDEKGYGLWQCLQSVLPQLQRYQACQAEEWKTTCHCYFGTSEITL